jgi:tRNA pseudouridine38-40 synthase
MPRYRLAIEYDGRPFVGWQAQDNGPSVQAALERAAKALDPGASGVTGAGRTDAGVHALGQAAHLDLAKDLPGDTVRDALNAHLRPDPVAVLDAVEVRPDFHARFDAIRRDYLYRIVERRAPLTFDAGLAWRVPQALDAGAMHEAAQALVGQHDFTTFRDAQCQAKSPVKTLDSIRVSRAGPEVRIECGARSFLHRQVRSMTGSLVQVGLGRWSRAELKAALDAADRARCGQVAPPDGLYLVAVAYA